MKRYWQFLQSYRFHKAAWPWASLKVQKGHTKVNVELVQDFYVEIIHVKLQHDTGNLWRVIAFTRFWTPPTQATTIAFSLRGLRGKNDRNKWISDSESWHLAGFTRLQITYMRREMYRSTVFIYPCTTHTSRLVKQLKCRVIAVIYRMFLIHVA